MENKYIEGVGEVSTPKTFKEKISNLWYHYKWHSIVAVFLIIAILVCSLQLCSKESYDIYILYAGSKQIGKSSADSDVPEIVTVMTTLKSVTDDYDGNGEKNIGFQSYYYLSNEEASKLGDNVNYTLLNQDKKTLEAVIEHSEYYLLFISPAVYEQYKGEDGRMFSYLTEFKAQNPNAEYYNDCAIKLSSLGFYSLPGVANLPEDTLICIKAPNLLASKDSAHLEHIKNAKSALEKILNYKASG